jgi:carbon storage regulator CsrA
VQVLALRRGAVRLGIEAPPDVAVLREELVGKPDPTAAEPRDR